MAVREEMGLVVTAVQCQWHGNVLHVACGTKVAFLKFHKMLHNRSRQVVVKNVIWYCSEGNDVVQL